MLKSVSQAASSKPAPKIPPKRSRRLSLNNHPGNLNRNNPNLNSLHLNMNRHHSRSHLPWNLNPHLNPSLNNLLWKSLNLKKNLFPGNHLSRLPSLNQLSRSQRRNLSRSRSLNPGFNPNNPALKLDLSNRFPNQGPMRRWFPRNPPQPLRDRSSPWRNRSRRKLLNPKLNLNLS